MKKFILFFLLFLQVLAYAKTVRVGYYDNEPKLFRNRYGKPDGFFIELTNAIARKERWNVQYVYGSWSELVNKLLNGEIDLLPDVAYTPERDNIFSFHSIPVLHSWLQVYTLSNRSISSVHQLRGKCIGVIKGSIQEKFLLEDFQNMYGFNICVKIYETGSELLEALYSEQVDCILSSRFFQYSRDCEKNIIPSSVVFNSGSLFYVTAKNVHDELLNAIDRNLQQMLNDGSSIYYRLQRKWFDHKPSFWSIIVLISVIVAVVFLLFYIHSRFVQNIINLKTREIEYAYQQLEKKEKNYRHLFENIIDAVVIFDATDYSLLDINERLVRLFGWTSKQEAKRRLCENFTLCSQQALSNFIQEFLEKSQTDEITVERTLHRADGVVFHAQLQIVRGSFNQRDVVILFIRDIEKQKRTEQQARKATALFNTLALNAPVGIFRTDASGKTIYVNPAWCEITGVSDTKALDYGWLDAIHPDDRQRVYRNWIDRLSKLLPSKEEFRIVHPDGKIIWVLGYAIPQFVDGAFDGYVGTMTDVTGLKDIQHRLEMLNQQFAEAHQKAEEANRLKTIFFSNLSHEIRTPMNAISGFASLLPQFLHDHEKTKHFVDLIQKSVHQLLSIINDIVEVSLIDTGQIQLKFEHMVLGDFFDHLKSLYDLDLYIERNDNTELIFQIPDSLKNFELYTDRAKLQQIMINLINNALKFTPEGYVLVECKMIGNQTMVFSVKDTGIGISLKDQKYIFERFYRAHHSDTIHVKGSGLGLTIVKSYVEMLGGNIYVVSEPQKGSLFYFTHPLKKIITSNSADQTSMM